jgi:hypothetical protein
VSARTQFADDLAADEAATADDYDLHDVPLMVRSGFLRVPVMSRLQDARPASWRTARRAAIRAASAWIEW